MQSSPSTTPQPEPENNYPDCLYIQLEGIPVQSDNLDGLEFWQTSTHPQQVDLHLTISFNEQWKSLKQGRVKFGLKGGQLRIKLENGEIPYDSRSLSGSVKLSLPPEKPEAERSKDRKGINFLVRGANAFSDGKKTGTQANNGTKPTQSRTNPVPIRSCHVTTKVSEENPTWVFEEEMGQPVLKGLLERVKLATLNITALPCRVQATFEVSQRDVCLTDAEGLWSPDLTRNKQAVLTRLIVQRLLEPQFKPYLSQAELHYE